MQQAYFHQNHVPTVVRIITQWIDVTGKMVFLQIILIVKEEVAKEALTKGVLMRDEARFVHIVDS